MEQSIEILPQNILHFDCNIPIGKSIDAFVIFAEQIFQFYGADGMDEGFNVNYCKPSAHTMGANEMLANWANDLRQGCFHIDHSSVTAIHVYGEAARGDRAIFGKLKFVNGGSYDGMTRWNRI